MTDELAALMGETSLSLLDTPAEERFDRLTRLTRACLRVSFSLLTVITPERQWFKSAQGTMLSESPVELSFCVAALRDGHTLVLEDLDKNPSYRESPIVCGAPHLRFYAGVPLRAPDGQWIGTLCALHDEPRGISEDELKSLEDLARCAEREIAISTWTESERALLEESAGSSRKALLDEATRCWNEAASLDLLLREIERSLNHRRTLSVLLLRTDLQDPEQAREKAELLRRTLASYHTLGRLADDLFLVILPELALSECEGLAKDSQALIQGAACVLGISSRFDSPPALRDYLLSELDQAGPEAVTVRGARFAIRARSLGPFELRLGDEAVAASRFRTSKTRLLLAYLLGCPDKRASTDVLLEEFWPDGGDSARNSLRGALSTLRGLLRESVDSPDPIVRDGNFVAISPTVKLWSDLDTFTQCSQSGDETSQARAIELYRGPYLDGEFEDWALRRRDGFLEIYLDTVKRLAQQTFTRGDFAQSALVAEQALAVAPERQDLMALLFRSWLRLGRPEAVGRRYRELENELRNDYGVEPSIELLELFHRAELGLTT